jgi:RNA polymerase sigma-70 factor (sigma-E family)
MRAVAEASVPFEDFVRARSAALFRTALLLTGQNRSEAEDLLQGALERAYRRWGRICRSGDPERYVRAILANASTDRWRRLGRRGEHSLPDDGSGGPVTGDHAGEVADRDFLLRALAGLPPRQRAVLVLRYFCDLPEAEIAAALGCSTGTVKSQASRALAKLREMSEAGREGARPERAVAETECQR